MQPPMSGVGKIYLGDKFECDASFYLETKPILKAYRSPLGSDKTAPEVLMGEVNTVTTGTVIVDTPNVLTRDHDYTMRIGKEWTFQFGLNKNGNPESTVYSIEVSGGIISTTPTLND